MRKFLSIGDGVPMTTFMLIVCGPVFVGLALLLYGLSPDISSLRDLVVNPGKHPQVQMWLLIIAQAVLSPGVATDDDEGSEQSTATTGLKRTSDLLWAMAMGILLCLMIVVDDTTTGTGRENVPAYIAFGMVVLSIALSWRDRRERKGYRPDRYIAD